MLTYSVPYLVCYMFTDNENESTHYAIHQSVVLCLSSRAVTRSYYRNAACVILLFDLTAHKTFENIHNWYQEVTERAQPNPLVFLLLGTKSDLRDLREVTREEAQNMANSINAPYLETSARTGSNVSAALSLICRELLQAAREEKHTTMERSIVGCSTGEEVQKPRTLCIC